MEDQSKMETPNSEGVWSPDALFSNHPHHDGSGVTSTPYCYPLSYKKLNESEGSTKQDSGYYSATPSTDSGLLFGKCQCHKSFYHSYSLSTPEYACSCEKDCTSGVSPNFESMDAIQEVKMSPTPFSSRIRLNRPIDLYEDTMDSSLYPEEMEVDNMPSVEKYQCSLDFSELAEEKSIDFLESQMVTTSNCPTKETPTVSMPTKSTADIVSPEVMNSHDSLQSGKKTEKAEDFFSPEIFSCDLVNPKVKNESTPTKLKRATPPTKMKKSCSFLSSATKVATMNRVLRSFYSINGIDRVDFLYQLGVKRNMGEIVGKIFSLLSEKDLDSVSQVSKTWKSLIKNDSDAFKRWRLHRNAMMLMKENLSSPVKHGGSVERNRPAFSLLQNVANTTSPPRQPFSPQQRASPPVSPGSIKFNSYWKAGKSLKKNERLLPCPKCRFPSTDRGSPVAQCPRSGCRHRFCVWCTIEVVPGLHHNCPPLYTPRCAPRKVNVHSVGSKSSKRNLRRL